jgi:transcriptional regulator with XRE-family HTH domain
MDINDNILSLIEKSPDAIMKGLSSRARARRLEMNLTQQALAARAGIPLGTYRRFEATGETSVRNLIMLALTLDMSDGFSGFFAERRYTSIEDVLERKKANARKRGRRNE